MNRDEADAKATELNRSLEPQSGRVVYYVPVETEPGEWDVEERSERKSWPRRLLDALLDSPGP